MRWNGENPLLDEQDKNHRLCLRVCAYIYIHTYSTYILYTMPTFLCQNHWLRSKATQKPAWQSHQTNTVRHGSLTIDISYIPYKHVILIINQLGGFETTGSKQANFNVGWWRLLYYSKILPTIVQFLQLKPSRNFSRANMLWTVSKWQTWLQYGSTLIMSNHVS